MTRALELAVFVFALVGTEGLAWAVHRYVMHGGLWSLHKSHHELRKGRLEKNDWFVVMFALPAIGLIAIGVHVWSWALPAGLGMTAYGLLYFFFHDGLVHRRFPVGVSGRSSFWRGRIQAHRLHHVVRTKEGCVSFGFLWARPAKTLALELRQKRMASSSGARAKASRSFEPVQKHASLS